MADAKLTLEERLGLCEDDDDASINEFLKASDYEQQSFLDAYDSPAAEGLQVFWDYLVRVMNLADAPFTRFQVYLMIHRYIKEHYANEFLMVTNEEEAREAYNQILMKVGGAKVMKQIIDAQNAEVEKDASELYREYLAKRVAAQKAKAEERAALYPPLYKTKEEQAGDTLEAKLRKMEGNENRADNEAPNWVWDDKHFPPKWVNARVWRPRLKVWEDHYHRFGPKGQCDPLGPESEDGDIPGCAAKQYAPDVPCKHEIAFVKFVEEKVKVSDNDKLSEAIKRQLDAMFEGIEEDEEDEKGPELLGKPMPRSDAQMTTNQYSQLYLLGNPKPTSNDECGDFFRRRFGRDLRNDEDMPPFMNRPFPPTNFSIENLFPFLDQQDADQFVGQIILQNMEELFTIGTGTGDITRNVGPLMPSSRIFECPADYRKFVILCLAKRVCYDILTCRLHNRHPEEMGELVEQNHLGQRITPHIVRLWEEQELQSPANWPIALKQAKILMEDDLAEYKRKCVEAGAYTNEEDAFARYQEGERVFLGQLRILEITKEELEMLCMCRECRRERARIALKAASKRSGRRKTN